jgi:hypothetical protein
LFFAFKNNKQILNIKHYITMFYIASTRFNNDTYDENMCYRKAHHIPVIYGTSIPIQNKYDLGSIIFVIEMNNEKNQIEGIGIIRNTQVTDKRHRIYSNNDYNRFIYHGEYWLSRNQLEDFDSELVEMCDQVLFKGKSHLKRQSGISILTAQLFTNWDYSLLVMKNKIRAAFVNAFKSVNNNINQINLKKLDDPSN